LVVGLLILLVALRGGANSKAHFRVRFRHNTLARSVITAVLTLRKIIAFKKFSAGSALS
jgi:hypothetical protein